MEDVADAAARAPRAPRASSGSLVRDWLPLLAWAALIFYFSSRPGHHMPRWWLLRHDKLIHAGVYAVLGLLASRALLASGVPLGRAAIFGVVLAMAYGVSDEWHQTFVAGRSGNDLGDLAADAAGAGGGAGAFVLGARRRARA